MEFVGEYKGTEEEIRARPSFEDWFAVAIKDREDNIAIRLNVVFYATMSNLNFNRDVLMQLSRANQGMKSAESPEFLQAQKEWWYFYGKIMILRSFLLRYYDVRAPDWRTEILPERLYCGVVMSAEDFKKFLTGPGSGLEMKKPETIADYEDEMKQKAKSLATNPLKQEFKEEEEAEEAEDDEKVAV